MGDTQDDEFALRRNELEREFEAMPKAGTAAYWHHIENGDGEQALPLEVLACCLCERYAAGAFDASHRIFTTVLGRIQSLVAHQAWRIARQARGEARTQLQEDLEQECYLKLWQELTTEGPTFFMVNFTHALARLQQHVAHAVMEQAGEWIRRDTTQPKRIPRKDIETHPAPRDSEDEPPIAERYADPTAESPFAQADLSDLRDLVNHLPAEQRDLIYDLYWRDRSREEIAAQRDITTRTVYNRLQSIYQQLGVRYAGGEEVQRGNH